KMSDLWINWDGRVLAMPVWAYRIVSRGVHQMAVLENGPWQEVWIQWKDRFIAENQSQEQARKERDDELRSIINDRSATEEQRSSAAYRLSLLHRAEREDEEEESGKHRFSPIIPRYRPPKTCLMCGRQFIGSRNVGLCSAKCAAERRKLTRTRGKATY